MTVTGLLEDGHPTTITFSVNADVELVQKTVTPPGVSGGGPNDLTNMASVAWRVAAPKHLKTLTQSSFTCHYNPACLTKIISMVNINQLITVNQPDGSKWKFWGWVDEFQPQEHKEGEAPLADCTIEPSNRNNTGDETAPVYVTPAPTTTGA